MPKEECGVGVKVWQGCYDGNWKGIIQDAAFSHPAKYARRLIHRIYQHALERGYLKPGDVIVDPFGGVALGALDALTAGVHWRGVELERRFHWLGAGGDCPGFTRETWRRFYARGARLFEQFGLCPDCQKAWEPGTHDCRGDAGMFGRREIPHREPHRFVGNLDLFRKGAVGGATAELYCGDSRRLCEVLGPALADCCIGSPPFCDGTHGTNGSFAELKAVWNTDEANANRPGWRPNQGQDVMRRQPSTQDSYGQTPGQLGAMRSGDVAAVLGSPPFSTSQQSRDGDFVMDSTDVNPTARKLDTQAYFPAGQDSGGNLAAMPTGSVDSIISSPPYSGNEKHDYRTDEARYRGKPQGVGCFNGSETYGDTAGNLGNLPSGDVSAIVSSPPYAESCVNDNQRTFARDGLRQGFNEGDGGTYGNQDGQLGAMPPGDVADAIVSSPPYEGSIRTGHGDGIDWNKATNGRGDTISGRSIGRGAIADGYADGVDGQLGSDTGETFWSAAREIVIQCHQILRSGGFAIWVCKDFVRNRERVPFSADWLRLCEACGFEAVEWIKASLVKEQRHPGLFGEDVVTKTERKGFFRRLAEKKGSPPIDEEDVIIVRKPARR